MYADLIYITDEQAERLRPKQDGTRMLEILDLIQSKLVKYCSNTEPIFITDSTDLFGLTIRLAVANFYKQDSEDLVALLNEIRPQLGNIIDKIIKTQLQLYQVLMAPGPILERTIILQELFDQHNQLRCDAAFLFEV